MNGRQYLDESRAAEFIGRTILIDVTYEDHKGEVTGRHQWFGTIKTYSNREGIKVDLDGSDDYCCLPPCAEAIRPAAPSICTLESSGRVVENPDYLTMWTRREADPKEKGK